jgi:hypothetical protein
MSALPASVVLRTRPWPKPSWNWVPSEKVITGALGTPVIRIWKLSKIGVKLVTPVHTVGAIPKASQLE